jgi:hypothetical protein
MRYAGVVMEVVRRALDLQRGLADFLYEERPHMNITGMWDGMEAEEIKTVIGEMYDLSEVSFWIIRPAFRQRPVGVILGFNTADFPKARQSRTLREEAQRRGVYTQYMRLPFTKTKENLKEEVEIVRAAFAPKGSAQVKSYAASVGELSTTSATTTATTESVMGPQAVQQVRQLDELMRRVMENEKASQEDRRRISGLEQQLGDIGKQTEATSAATQTTQAKLDGMADKFTVMAAQFERFFQMQLERGGAGAGGEGSQQHE